MKLTAHCDRPCACVRTQQLQYVACQGQRSYQAKVASVSSFIQRVSFPGQAALPPLPSSLLMSIAAWATAGSLLINANPVHATMAERAVAGGPQEVIMSKEEAQYDENLMTSDLRDFLMLLDTKGNNLKSDQLQLPRSKVNAQV
jgi:hypothetical protein